MTEPALDDYLSEEGNLLTGYGTSIRETAKAVGIRFTGGPEVKWVPKIAIHDDSEVWKNGQSGKVVLHAWFAKEPSQTPNYWSKVPQRGKEVLTPDVLRNLPLKPPGRK